jgi:hypothetical protein
MPDQQSLENMEFDGSNLWKEENFTDLKAGTIRKLTHQCDDAQRRAADLRRNRS